MFGDKHMRILQHSVGALLLVSALFVGPTFSATVKPIFKTPEDAVAALVKGLQDDDATAIGGLLGPGKEGLIRSGDKIKDRQEVQSFLDAYADRHVLTDDGVDRRILHVGKNDWSLPIPLVQHGGSWTFDAQAGTQEIIDRRVGHNELEAIRLSLAYGDAQKGYFDLYRQATGAGLYAQRLISTPGNYDGLFWESASGIPESPFAALVATAIDQGYPGQLDAGKPVPYQGYYFRILTAQGPHAPGGAKDYVQGDKMVDGFGLIAWPTGYGRSGIMTFVLNQDGVVFQKDLGTETAARAAVTKSFDPGIDWARVDVKPE